MFDHKCCVHGLINHCVNLQNCNNWHSRLTQMVQCFCRQVASLINYVSFHLCTLDCHCQSCKTFTLKRYCNGQDVYKYKEVWGSFNNLGENGSLTNEPNSRAKTQFLQVNHVAPAKFPLLTPRIFLLNPLLDFKKKSTMSHDSFETGLTQKHSHLRSEMNGRNAI